VQLGDNRDKIRRLVCTQLPVSRELTLVADIQFVQISPLLFFPKLQDLGFAQTRALKNYYIIFYFLVCETESPFLKTTE